MPNSLSGRTIRFRRVAVTAALTVATFGGTAALLATAPSATAARAQPTVMSDAPAPGCASGIPE